MRTDSQGASGESPACPLLFTISGNLEDLLDHYLEERERAATIEALGYQEKVELGSILPAAIIEDIVDKLTSPFLVGMTLKELNVIFNQWIESESQNFSAAVVPMLHEVLCSRVQERPVNMKIKATSMENLGKVLDVYEFKLSKHKYLAGDSYTLADFVHLPLLSLVGSLDVFKGVFDKRPRVKAWVADITSTTAFLKTNKLD